MPQLNLCCPKCLPAKRTQLVQNGHKVNCTDGHEFIDTVELLSMKPEPFNGQAFPTPKLKPPESPATLTITIDSKLHTALQSRFGDKLDASLVAIVGSLAEPGSFIVNAEDARRISERSKHPVKDGSSLAGAVFDGFKELEELKEKVKAMESSRGDAGTTAADCISIKMDMETVMKIAEKAAFQGKRVPQYLSEVLSFALDNGWM